MGATTQSRIYRTHSSLRGCLRLKDHAERAVLDEIFEKRSERWPEDTPDTKEAYFIRDLFDSELFSAFRRVCSPHRFRFVPLGDRSENSRSVRIAFSLNHFPRLSSV